MRIDSIKIKLLIAEKGMTQTEFAEKCGIAKQNISLTLCRGTCFPAKVKKMAAVLGVTAEEIIREEN